MSDDLVPQSDQAESAPHPRETFSLYGQEHAETQFLRAVDSGRLHHAWMVSGPKGVGKATFAWRAARFLLTRDNTGNSLFAGSAETTDSMEVSADHPISKRILALSEPGLKLIRLPWDSERKRLKAQITIDEVRKLGGFFGLSATDGGHRIVIVDAADDLNRSAANGLLKILEEPPKNSVIFLITHAPQRLLPTIRSRCREVRLSPLGERDLGLALADAGLQTDQISAVNVLANGSVGDAVRLIGNDGAQMYQKMLNILSAAPQIDRGSTLAMADNVTARGAEPKLDQFFWLADITLGRLACSGVGLPPVNEVYEGEASILKKLAPNVETGRQWAELQQTASERIGHARAVNIDPKSLVMDLFLKMNDVPRRA